MTMIRRSNVFIDRYLTIVLGAAIFVVASLAYVATVPPVQVPGDPSEYTFIPWILGIAHPPGYAFYTLLAAVWQRLVPIGSVAYRTHLLAAIAGALAAVLVYLIVLRLIGGQRSVASDRRALSHLPAVFAGLSFAAATDVWQHSIHTNAHIITLLLATLSVFVLIEWWRTERDRWLYLFALIAGLSPAQHPLLVFAFPAYAIFVVIVKPRLFLQPQKILALIGCLALGLSIFLYYPLRSPTTPFGVSDIRSWDTFVHFVSAEGLRVNLFHFGLADQLTRFGVFFELLKLQFSIISIVLAIPGAIWLARHAIKPFVLCTLFFVSLYIFIINTVQDVMAYLLLPFMMLSIFIGLGAWAISELLWSNARLRAGRNATGDAHFSVATPPVPRVKTWQVLILSALLLVPIEQMLETYPRVSLSSYTAGRDWVNVVFDRFAGKGEHATLLTPWEAMTPLWVAQYTEGRMLDPNDVNLVYVTTASANPWLDNVFAYLKDGPIYLADYRRPVIEGKLFRLRPEGSWPLWRVVPPGETSVPALDHTLNLKTVGADADGSKQNALEVLGYSLDRDTVEAGQTAHLTLAMRAPMTPTHIIMPYAIVGDRPYRWTTDSRLLTPDWLPNEVIVERYDITLPFDTPPGYYALMLGFSDLNTGRDVLDPAPLQKLGVGTSTRPHVDVPPDAVANFNAQIALLGATANGAKHTPDLLTIAVKPGETIDVWLNWLAQQQIDESYTVFVHLIDGNNQLVAQQDYTPMGGAFPTHLWIPKWIAGQSVNDPYQIQVPGNLPPGEYFIEAGMYGMTSQRRAPIIGRDGGLGGDRVVLFKVSVRP